MPKILAFLRGKERRHQETPKVVHHLQEAQFPLRELGALQERSPLLVLLLIGREFFTQSGRYRIWHRRCPAFERCADGRHHCWPLGFPVLAVLMVVASVIGAFYYLRVVWYMYFDPVEDTAVFQSGLETRFVLSLNGLAVLALGILPGWLMQLCLDAIG